MKPFILDEHGTPEHETGLTKWAVWCEAADAIGPVGKRHHVGHHDHHSLEAFAAANNHTVLNGTDGDRTLGELGRFRVGQRDTHKQDMLRKISRPHHATSIDKPTRLG